MCSKVKKERGEEKKREMKVTVPPPSHATTHDRTRHRAGSSPPKLCQKSQACAISHGKEN